MGLGSLSVGFGSDEEGCDADGAAAAEGVSSGAKRPAPAPVSADEVFKSFISTALLWLAVESCSSLAEAPAMACASTGGFATAALCSSLLDAIFLF